MKYISIVLLLLLNSGIVYSQTVKNTSYQNQSGENVLRLEVILQADINSVWQQFTIDEKLKKWMAPVAHIELSTGGYILTNYDTAKKLTDSSSIRLPIINFINNQLLTLKINLNKSFPQAARNTDQNLQEIIQFVELDNRHTKVISSMVGFGKGIEWDKTYDFFSTGNEQTFKKLLKQYMN